MLLTSDQIADLARCHGIPGLAAIDSGQGGLPRVVISTPQCEGEMYLHGGHVTAWAPRGSSKVLYCSPNTNWRDGAAIRGGVPVCFPWFGDKTGDPSAPAHGTVRTKEWQLQAIERVEDSIRVSMMTENDAQGRKWWPFAFQLVCRATFGANLELELIVTNPGSEEFSFEEALHAYFAVGDVQAVSLDGLDGTRYIDKVDQFTEKSQSGDVRFSGETDRIYLNTAHDIQLMDPACRRRIILRKQNSADTVTWNPWAVKSTQMKDLGAGEWSNFVCVETANVGASGVRLAPGETHIMAAHVSCGQPA